MILGLFKSIQGKQQTEKTSFMEKLPNSGRNSENLCVLA